MRLNSTAQDILGRVTSAALWTYGGVFSDRVFRFLVFLIVARLAPAAQFGEVLLSLLAVEAVQSLLDLGLPMALLQQTEVSKPQLDTVFLLNMAASLATSGVLFFGAPLFSRLTGEPAAAALLRVLALAPIASGLGAVHVALIRRELGFKALAWRQAASSLAASVVALILAGAGLGVWALVGRAVALALCGTILAWSAAAFRPAFG